MNGDIGNTQGLSNLGAKIKSLALLRVKMLIRNSNGYVEKSVGYVEFLKEGGPGHRELRVIFASIAQAGCACEQLKPELCVSPTFREEQI